MNLVCVHKGLPLPGSSVEHNHPRDIEKAALDHPDINFIVYHSGFKVANYELPPGDGYIQEGGYLPWTTDLVRMREANPGMTKRVHGTGNDLRPYRHKRIRTCVRISWARFSRPMARIT